MLPLRDARTRVTRRIAADPTSTALLLAGPTAVDMWPGVRRIGERDGRLLVELVPSSREPASDTDGALVAVRALPPKRTPTAYVTRFAWSSGDELELDGRLTLAYAPTADGLPVTHAVLELEVAERDLASRLALGAESFLANLAAAAETRNRAA